MLAVIETHPVQYHAPVYRALQRDFGVPITAVYGSDFSVVGYRDREFGSTFAWDSDLLEGYSSVFLTRFEHGDGVPAAKSTSTRGLRRALRAVRPTAVLLVGYSPRFYQMACFEAIQLRRPLLLRAETTDHAVHRQALAGWLRDRTLRWLYGRCERLLYVGQRSVQHFQRLGCPDEKLVFSPYCVDTTPFDADETGRRRLRARTRRALGIAPNETVLLLSGKLVRRKRPDLLLRAAKLLPDEKRPYVRVLVLGSGEEQPALEALARETPSVPFQCVGFRNQTQLSAYYHAADLLVLPSEHGETWGLVVNEALHHGLPCVVSDAVGSAPDLIRDGRTGEVFTAGSAAGLADALQRSWQLVGQAHVRDACRAAVSTYSVENAAAGIAQAYEVVAHAA